MKLRNHPALNYNGIRSWPPLWSPAKTPEDKKTLRGEIGILKSTYTVPKTRECYLVIEHENEQYVGSIFCSDTKFCTTLAMVLALKQNHRIEEIGDLEL